jgi:hypothetical protein
MRKVDKVEQSFLFLESGKVWFLSAEAKMKKLKSKIIITGEPGVGKSPRRSGSQLEK